MAERRAIKSKIWDDEFYGELSFFEQVVWIGLFSRCADDQGRLVDNAILISSQLFPYKAIPANDIEQALITFGDHIIRYSVNGKAYIQLCKWWENQPLQYAVPSNYPAPDGWVDRYRTNYKGKHIVYNWDGMANTELGTLLYMKLKSLARVSSWTDQLGTLNLNPNPNPNPNSMNGKVKGRSEEEPAAPPDLREEKVYRAVTRYATIPAGDLQAIVNAIQKIRQAHSLDDNGCVSYLRPYWTTFKKRYPGSLGCFWLTDWAVIGMIPDATNVKKPKVLTAEQELDQQREWRKGLDQ